MENKPEYWLAGPVDNITGFLQPVAHALLQAKREVRGYTKDFPEELVWNKVAGLASVGFHLQHLSGVLDRLFTYARGEQLSEKQLTYLRSEAVNNSGISIEELVLHFDNQVDRAISQLADTKESELLSARGVGRKQIPSTVLGLLFHAAEHTMRHTGQLLVTIKVLTENKKAGD